MSGVIRWEDPPKTPSIYQAAADALRLNPNTWAVIREGMKTGAGGNLVWKIKSGIGPWGPAASFDAKCVGGAGSTSAKVYARYVGEPS